MRTRRKKRVYDKWWAEFKAMLIDVASMPRVGGVKLILRAAASGVAKH